MINNSQVDTILYPQELVNIQATNLIRNVISNKSETNEQSFTAAKQR